jgi:8-oxo-dGTP diphosphatase
LEHDGCAVDAGLPAIPVSASALIYDQAGRLLILKPTYKSGWTIPGGVMEADGETPWDACRREVREECGLEVRGGRLASVDFRPGRPGHPGGVRFLFDCGTVDDADLGAITVQPEEVAEYRFVPLGDALVLLRPPIRRRVRAATRRRRCVYLENACPVSGSLRVRDFAALRPLLGSWGDRVVPSRSRLPPMLTRMLSRNVWSAPLEGQDEC